jgi:hypothetical protein
MMKRTDCRTLFIWLVFGTLEWEIKKYEVVSGHIRSVAEVSTLFCEVVDRSVTCTSALHAVVEMLHTMGRNSDTHAVFTYIIFVSSAYTAAYPFPKPASITGRPREAGLFPEHQKAIRYPDRYRYPPWP